MSAYASVILAAALLPAVVLLIVMLIRDKEHPEPPRMLVKGVFFGVLSVFVSFTMSFPLSTLSGGVDNYSSFLGALWNAFALAAVPEECAKLLCLWLLLRKNPYFDEHLDGIVYAVCIGLGFAAFENIMYVFEAGENWAATALLRGVLSVPAHFFFAVLMGYYYSLVHFGHHPRRNAPWVLFAPILAHGIFDTIAMSQEVSEGMEGLLAVALLLFCNELRKLCKRHIIDLKAADEDHYNRNPFQ